MDMGWSRSVSKTMNISQITKNPLKRNVYRLKLLWLTLTQANSKCEIEFLPVYVPNEEEKKDPKLFAHNVRNVMAK